mmetsp:Transcript_4798/g.8441  ORF Transcript_4798/g.8441 Transcript_4798/m.8441 type:complete len:102 (-) Transcript_4798:195-500(-)
MRGFRQLESEQEPNNFFGYLLLVFVIIAFCVVVCKCYHCYKVRSERKKFQLMGAQANTVLGDMANLDDSIHQSSTYRGDKGKEEDEHQDGIAHQGNENEII